MTEQDLVREAIASLNTTPRIAPEGRYLTMLLCESIVDDTIALLARLGKQVELAYLQGHRRRLATTLSMIPVASSPEARLLDVGCYGYTSYWAHRHLGYGVVEGVEWLPDAERVTADRVIDTGEGQFSFVVHNFDISRSEWPLDARFDTILFLETLEHVNHDPAGVLTNIVARLRPAGTLVSSVPNSISYKTLQEFMAGAPPWNYWFFHPDLEHEPRHVFEYTPIFFKSILLAAGLREVAFRTICAFQDVDSLGPYFAIGEMLSITPALFGDTMIAVLNRDEMAETIRFPALIYNKEAYYEAVYPLMFPRLVVARDGFFAFVAAEANKAQLREAAARQEAEGRAAEAEEANKAWARETTARLDAEARAAEAVSRTSLALSLCAESQLREAAARQEAETRTAEAEEANKAWARETTARQDAEARAAEAVSRTSLALSLCAEYLSVLQDSRVGAGLWKAETSQRNRAAGDPLIWINRSWFERLLFRPDGRPVKVLRRLVFHTSGQPRAIFGRLAFKKNGKPRPSFQQWLASEAYRALPKAVKLG